MAHHSEQPFWVEFSDIEDRMQMGTLMRGGYPIGGYEQLPNGRVLMHRFVVERGLGPLDQGDSVAAHMASLLVIRHDIDSLEGAPSIPNAKQTIERACKLPERHRTLPPLRRQLRSGRLS